MSKSKIFILALLLTSSLWMGCKKQDDGSYTAPITVYEKVKGTWNLSVVSMIDETARAAGIKPDEIVLTDQFNFKTFSIQLNVDDKNLSTTYAVNGNVPQLLAPQGYWALDSDFPQTNGTPLKINLYSDAAKTLMTNQLTISNMPGALSAMDLKLTHTSNKVAYVTYQYKLVLAK